MRKISVILLAFLFMGCNLTTKPYGLQEHYVVMHGDKELYFPEPLNNPHRCFFRLKYDKNITTEKIYDEVIFTGDFIPCDGYTEPFSFEVSDKSVLKIEKISENSVKVTALRSSSEYQYIRIISENSGTNTYEIRVY